MSTFIKQLVAGLKLTAVVAIITFIAGMVRTINSLGGMFQIMEVHRK